MASLDATVIQAYGATAVRHAMPVFDSSIDCFFLYPTVSTEQTLNADVQVQPAETAAAMALAAPFSQVCQVWAPMYRRMRQISAHTGNYDQQFPT